MKLTKLAMSKVITSALFNVEIDNFTHVQEKHAKALSRNKKDYLIGFYDKAVKIIQDKLSEGSK